jgi:type IV secretory pathway VirD2 relaxase
MHEGATLLEAEDVWAESKQDIIRSFAMQRPGRKEIKQPVGHILLSFSPKDKGRMTDEFMVQLAKEYMLEIGICNTQYIIVRHDNTDNPHLHIVYNRINNDLKLISVNHD